MSPKIYIDGRFYDKKDARISVFDHGLLYGDGVFEGIRSYNRLVFRLEEHIDRLYESARGIMLDIPLTKTKMMKAVCAALKLNKLNNAYIRLIITRGEGDLGLDPRKCRGNARVIIITDRIALYPDKLCRQGLSIITISSGQNMSEVLSPQVKSLNYLNNIMAKIKAINSGCEEAILLNSVGHITEGTGDNIFIVKGKRVFTPPVHLGILKGITRDAVFDIAGKKKIRLKEAILGRHDIYNADECFLTGTAAEIIPVVKADGKAVADGEAGKLTLMFRDEFHKLTKIDGARY